MIQPDFVFRGHQAAVNCVHFLANGRYLVSGDQDGLLIVWNMLLKRQLVKQSTAHTSAILAISSVDSSTIITQGRDNKLNIWTLEAHEFSGSLNLTQSLDIESLNFCRFSISEHWICGLVADELGNMFIYNVHTRERHAFSVEHKSVSRSGAHNDQPMCVCICANDGLLQLTVGYESNKLRCFYLQVSNASVKVTAVCSVQTPHTEPLLSISVNQDAQNIYTCAADNNVCCFKLDGTALVKTAAAELSHPGGSLIQCFQTPQVVAVAGWDYAVHLYDHGLQHLKDVRFHRAALTAVDVSSKFTEPLPDITDDLVQQRWKMQPQWMAVASRDSRISLWNVNAVLQP
ncbi:Astra associated protein 1 Asa1 [Coemansia erecta]|nr:Astra associated protein 1 Asa1 [Coemansia erecta]